MATQFGTDHYDLVLRPDVVQTVEDLTWYLDEPFGDTSAIPTYMVSKLASEHVKVVLSGDGGDELFAGYDKYVVEGRERSLRHGCHDRSGSVPARSALCCRTACTDAVFCDISHSRARSGISTRHRCSTPTRCRACSAASALEQLLQHDPSADALCVPGNGTGDWLSAIQYRDLNHYLPLDILTKVDRMTMAHSLEARPPLLDHPLVEFAATIPATIPPARRHDQVSVQAGDARPGCRTTSSTGRSTASPCRSPIGSEATSRDSRAIILLSDTCRQRGIFDVAVHRTAASIERSRAEPRSSALDDSVVRALVSALPRSAPASVRAAQRRSRPCASVTPGALRVQLRGSVGAS